MPTPFQHLIYAKAVLEAPTLPEALHASLNGIAGAFLLGNTAADVQTLTGQRRVETHFYEIPPAATPRAWEALLRAYPKLSDPERLPREQAAFVSGYLLHLVWDERWAWDVFGPFYLYSATWSDYHTFSVHHNALRVLMDREAEKALQAAPEILGQLRQASPNGWLPFVPDGALAQWRDWIIAQLEEPATVQTAQVFAERMRIAPEALEAVVQAIAAGTYTPAIPGLQEGVAGFEARAMEEGLTVLKRYWERET